MKALKYGQTAGFMRRLAALFYDGLLLIALLMMSAGIIVALLEALHAANIFSYGHYQDVSDFLSNHPIAHWLFQFYLLFVWLGFFISFWRKGQTLGMRAWQLRVQSKDGTNINTKQALLRCISSLFGLGNLTILFTRPKRSLQDICSQSEVILYPTSANIKLSKNKL